jgi:aromatic ring-opening dioxygenase LigB subunit
VGRRFADQRLEATIVVTPHNVHVDGHFAVVTAGNASGEFAEYELEVETHRELARTLLEVFGIESIPAVGVSYGGNDVREAVMPLDWGALVPLWFLPRTPVVVVSPARDRSWDEHVRAGAALARATGMKRIGLVASADHGHAHDPEGPYGFDPGAKEYDERIVELVEANRLRGLLGLEPSLVERAKADSLWQLLMLHGALGDGYTGELLAYEAPTYYGMLTAAYALK